MSYFPGSPISDRIRVELIEADVEQVFGLVDLADAEAQSGNALKSKRILEDAESVFLDIERRLAHLGTSESFPFLALVEELRRSIDTVRSRPL